ncbi:hypothetical protein B0T26DRAFT_76162 [Lasiosphaeria miniovina]|uniref:Inhibitor I9 domain-containing protein n=1 Tax=Lasiosphaeria miniovina TaxID=1954250 RepID=A0AA40BHZ3_9PEZI|nr:uncharacterized protein B0T26DRAFT_76162 [Lasiosphaeria miniovina]KAK0734581.1 hypothetical protein B0T26DRAFT_76162 [Lasiosphaeria miniovina]
MAALSAFRLRHVSLLLVLAIGSRECESKVTTNNIHSSARAPSLSGPARTPPPVAFSNTTPIPNHYIVQYHDSVEAAARVAHLNSVHAAAVVNPAGAYRGVIKHINIGSGFSAFHGELPPEQVQQLRDDNLVSVSLSP